MLIRTRDSEATIREVLTGLLNQRLPPRRVVIVDNQSRDATLAIVHELVPEAVVVEYPAGEPFNYSKALNLGMAEVDCEFCLIVSSHVILKRFDVTQKSLSFLRESPKYGAVVYGSVKDRDLSFNAPSPSITDAASEANNRGQMIRTSCWVEEPFCETIPTCEDQLWSRAIKARAWAVAVLPEVISYENPYKNTAKRVQEAYVMGRWIDTWGDTGRASLCSVRVLLIKGARFRLREGLAEIQVLFSRLLGKAGVERNYGSSSYRKRLG
ncbi:glycosyltransferase [Roseibacillus ishigakijimensis]|uniref:glycosyltransferase n=1 Tax=Roseibacillus ishigakijimensis TaxID=454146 RepID=UPI0027DD2457|nr:glycosyltransferase [Roseibacillus ishigakijimensis]